MNRIVEQVALFIMYCLISILIVGGFIGLVISIVMLVITTTETPAALGLVLLTALPGAYFYYKGRS